MRIFIPSYNRPHTLQSHLLWPEGTEDYWLIVHDRDQECEYLKNRTIDPKRIIVSNVVGIASTRVFIQEKLTSKGEWYLSLDDNVRSLTAFPEPYYSQAFIPKHTFNGPGRRKLALSPLSWEDFKVKLTETHNKAIAGGSNMIGFAAVDNPFFRTIKYRWVGFVRAKLRCIKNTGAFPPTGIEVKDDYAWTAEYLKRDGRVLINNFIWPESQNFEAGGCGSRESRIARYVKDGLWLMMQYPGLFSYNNSKANAVDKSEVIFKLRSLEQVAFWRKRLHQPLVTDVGAVKCK